MLSNQNNTMDTATQSSTKETCHKLSNNWTLWAHLPHNTDWSLTSYIPVSTFTSVEETICVTETLPEVLVENCMLFIMKEGVKPIWEDLNNRNGGSFSYKVSNKNVFKVWKDLTYVLVGESISNHSNFVKSVTGITISPKKSFCIIKIWMADCNNQNPCIVTTDVKGITPQGCIFKKHIPEY
jgi:translation initiation factor 4E